MNTLVKIFSSADGEKYARPVWHAIDNMGDGPRTICSGEVFGEGESRCKFELKQAKRGITCENCKRKIRYFKSINL